jgi:mitochondrial fission protein ELM1
MPPDVGAGIPARDHQADKNVRPTIRVVIASDGKRGHENQSRVLARMLGDTEPLLMRLRNPEGGVAEKLLRARFALLGPKSLSQQSAAALVRTHLMPESPEEFRDFATDVGKHRGEYRVFTVSTGTPPATMNLLLARLLGAEPLCVMTPSMLPNKLFKLLVVPEHDVKGKASENLISTPLALGFFNESLAAFQAQQIGKESKLDPRQRLLAVALGNTHGTNDDNWNELAALRDVALHHGYRLLITTSRRSPKAYMELLPEVITQDHPQLVAHLVDAASNPMNPLPGYSELAERMVVTNDSFSMICEAIHAGHQPAVMHLSESDETKIGSSLRRLKEQGLLVGFHSGVQPMKAFGVKIGLESTKDEVWAGTPGRIFQPNQFYNELRTEVRSRLQLEDAVGSGH